MDILCGRHCHRSPRLSPLSHFLARKCRLGHSQRGCWTSPCAFIGGRWCAPLSSNLVRASSRQWRWSRCCYIWCRRLDAVVSVRRNTGTTLLPHAAAALLKIHQGLLKRIHGHVVATVTCTWKSLSALGRHLIVRRSDVEDIVANIQLEGCAWISLLLTFWWWLVAIEYVAPTDRFRGTGIGRADIGRRRVVQPKRRLRCPRIAIRTVIGRRLSHVILLFLRLAAERRV